MSYSISGTTISLTRGDTFVAHIEISDHDGTPYIPREGDRIRFAMKAKVEEESPLLLIDIPTSDMVLVIRPEDTAGLPFGRYVYDIQLTKESGEVDTFIPLSTLRLTEEVH